MKTRLLSVGFVVFFLLLAMPVFAANTMYTADMSRGLGVDAVDLKLDSITTSPADIQPNEVVTITIGIENLGNKAVSDAKLDYSVKKDGTVIASGNKDNIGVGALDSRTEIFYWTPIEPGSYTITANVSHGNDIDISNNQKSTALSITSELEIVKLSATPTLYVDSNGYCDQTLEISGFVKQDGIGTNDGVLVYIGGTLLDYAKADGANAGYFSSKTSGMYFDLTGSYTVTVIVDKGSSPAQATTTFTVKNRDGSGGPGDAASDDYAVDVKVDPHHLEIEAGETSEYIIRVKNIGEAKDTYFLSYNSNTEVELMLDLEEDEVTLSPGEVEYISLYVDVPRDAVGRSYPIDIKAKGETGNAYDKDVVDFTVIEKLNLFDLEIGELSFSPDTAYTDGAKTVLVSAPVRFMDLTLIDGNYVTVKLYVEDTLVDSKSVYFVTGQTKTVEFYISTDEAPINKETGEYSVYMYASVEKETDKSPSAVFTVKEPGTLDILLAHDDINTTINGTFAVDLQVMNNDYRDHELKLSAEGIIMDVKPSTVTVAAGESKIIRLNATVADVSPGDYTAKIVAKNDNIDGYDVLNMHISEVAEGSGMTGAGTGLITAAKGGWLALLLLVAIMAVLLGYYYYSKQDEEVIEHEGEEKKPEEGDSASAMKQALFLRNLKKEPAKPKGPVTADWTMHDAERVLKHPHILTSEFHQNFDEAKGIKYELDGATPFDQNRIQKQEFGAKAAPSVDVNRVAVETEAMVADFNQTLDEIHVLKGGMRTAEAEVNGKLASASGMENYAFERPGQKQVEYDAFGNIVSQE